MIDFDLLQKDWAEAQKLPKNRRHHKQERIAQSLIKEFPGLKGLGSQIQLLCEKGNPAGWAFAYGYTVLWFPSRGIAKREYYTICSTTRRNPLQCFYANPMRPANKPKPCTLLEACEWGGWGLQAWI